VCELLQCELDKFADVKVKVVALVNDTVGTLLAHSYVADSPNPCILGAIFGTGTNGAYVEKLSRVTKLGKLSRDGGNMVINTEWGNFDNGCSVIGDSEYDQGLDKASVNPGFQMFEKRVSGLFLGEILRQALVSLHKKSLLFPGQSPPPSFFEPFALDTALMSTIADDNDESLKDIQKAIYDIYQLSTSLDERSAIQRISKAIGRRSARLSAIPIAAIIEMTADTRPKDQGVDVGVDGSVFEYYPNFVPMLREALRSVLGDQEQLISVDTAKDGSGVGAALAACVAHV